jgi:hypothetical protein
MVAGHENLRFAVLAFAEIKAAVEDFDRGDSNLFEALDRIRDALSAADCGGDSQRRAA